MVLINRDYQFQSGSPHRFTCGQAIHFIPILCPPRPCGALRYSLLEKKSCLTKGFQISTLHHSLFDIRCSTFHFVLNKTPFCPFSSLINSKIIRRLIGARFLLNQLHQHIICQTRCSKPKPMIIQPRFSQNFFHHDQIM